MGLSLKYSGIQDRYYFRVDLMLLECSKANPLNVIEGVNFKANDVCLSLHRNICNTYTLRNVGKYVPGHINMR